MKKLFTVALLIFLMAKLIHCQGVPNRNKHGDLQSSEKIFSSITELNIGLGLGDTFTDYSKRLCGISFILGYQVLKNINLGIGTGLSFYNGGLLVPLFLDLRGVISLGKISGYAFGDGGILFNFSESDYEDRILLNPGIGIMFPISNKISGNIGTGLLVQTTKDRGKHDSFVNLKVGITYAFRK